MTIQHQMVEWLSDKSGRMWKKAVVACIYALSRNALECTVENHEKRRSRKSVSRQRFEPGISVCRPDALRPKKTCSANATAAIAITIIIVQISRYRACPKYSSPGPPVLCCTVPLPPPLVAASTTARTWQKPDRPQAKAMCSNRLMGGGGIREDGEVLSRICLHRLTRACYEQRNVCCVHLQHAPFCTENKPARTLTAAVADSSYIQEPDINYRH